MRGAAADELLPGAGPGVRGSVRPPAPPPPPPRPGPAGPHQAALPRQYRSVVRIRGNIFGLCDEIFS